MEIICRINEIILLFTVGMKSIFDNSDCLLLTVLIIFIILDYISGILRAIIEHRLSSKIGYKGILKKIFIFIIIFLAYLIDEYVLKSKDLMLTVVVELFYISNEGISILENASIIGIPVPRKFKNIVLNLEESTENETEKTDIGKK